mgnify:CR=1 FL=1
MRKRKALFFSDLRTCMKNNGILKKWKWFASQDQEWG